MRRDSGRCKRQLRDEIVDPATVDNRHGNGRSPPDLRRGEDLVGDGADIVQTHVVDEVALGECHDTSANAEQLEHREMLVRLWHPSFPSIDDQQCRVDCACTCDHRADEIGVPGCVDKTESHVTTGHVCEPELDRHAAPLFFGQAIWIGAGDRAHQRRLAVVDVSGGDDDGHRWRCNQPSAVSASTMTGSSVGATVRMSITVWPSRVRAMIGIVDRRS